MKSSVENNVSNSTRESLGLQQNSLRVAIVGAGPAGFYAAEALLRQTELKLQVDLYDRLPTPYGLVRGGVAPDHPKIKSVARLFERTAERKHFRFFGNVRLDQDLSLAELLRCYHQVLICCGCERSHQLSVEKEGMLGWHGAADFVGWYNGHPDHCHHHFPLEQVSAVAVIGNGNVALDVARILAKDAQALAQTDIAAHALAVLRRSQVREIYIIGRRGPAQATFSNPELRGMAEISNADLVVAQADTKLDSASIAKLAQTKNPTCQRNVEWLQQHACQPLHAHPRKVVLRFLCSPLACFGTQKLTGLQLGHNRLVQAGDTIRAEALGSSENLPVQLAFSAVGYQGTPLAGLPFDAQRGIIPNLSGRVKPRVYVAGWIKRGPSGVIGSNKLDANETVSAMLVDAKQVGDRLPCLPASSELDDPLLLLKKKCVQFVDFRAWQRLNTLECERGQQAQPQKPREKFVSIKQMLQALGKSL